MSKKIFIIKYTTNGVKYFEGDWNTWDEWPFEAAYRILKENEERVNKPVIIIHKEPFESRYGSLLRITQYLSGLDWVHKTDIMQKPNGTIFLPKKAVEEFIKALKEASK